MNKYKLWANIELRQTKIPWFLNVEASSKKSYRSRILDANFDSMCFHQLSTIIQLLHSFLFNGYKYCLKLNILFI